MNYAFLILNNFVPLQANRKTMMQNELNYLDRNEFNFEPSEKVVEAIRNFNPKICVSIPASTTKGRRALLPFA